VKKLAACPVCQGIFRVDEACLSASEGQARCGQCLHVFDVAAHWIDPATVLARIRAERGHMPSVTDAPSLRSVTSVSMPNLPGMVRTPSFLAAKLKPRYSAWPWRRGGYALSIILTMLLGLSILWTTRNSVLARWPSTEPIWIKVCGWLYPRWDCHLRAQTELDSLSLEGISLLAQETPFSEHMGRNLAGSGSSSNLNYSLQWMLRNHTDHAVALPALVLHLTDTQGAKLARWTFEPPMWLPGREVSPAQAQQEHTEIAVLQNSGAQGLRWRIPAQAQWAVVTPLAPGSVPSNMRAYRAWLRPSTAH
jgi:predicted Zn finger-like uncharacterized protein